jgi:spore coat polysaccharide biosynthesis predicted glycosyltransferase SpsG
MGHFFRALNIVKYLQSRNESYHVLLNDNAVATAILVKKGIPFEVVDLNDFKTDWETKLIQRHGIKIWLNDRLNTDIRHASNVKKNGALLITLDDSGSGAELADLHFGCQVFDEVSDLKGKHIFTGIDYLILSKEIDAVTRVRTRMDNILVTLGGSDTHGIALNVVEILKQIGTQATIITGPSFQHGEQLRKLAEQRFGIKPGVPSLIGEMVRYDLAITGGGLTPFEANASGLPCIVVAAERHEIPNARFLEQTGSSVMAGFRNDLDPEVFKRPLNVRKMSEIGIRTFHTSGVDNMFQQIKIKTSEFQTQDRRYPSA